MEKQKQRPRSSKSDYNEYWRKAESPPSSGGQRLRSSAAPVRRRPDDSSPSQSRDHDEKPSPDDVIVNNNNDGVHRGATKDSKSRRQMADVSRDKSSAHSTGNVVVGREGGDEATGSRDRHSSVRPYFEPMRRAYWMDEYKMEDNYYMYSLAKIYDVTPMKRQKERQYWNILQHLGYNHHHHRHHPCPQWNGYERYLSRPRTTEHRRLNSSATSQRNQRSRSTVTSAASAANGKSAKSKTEEEEKEEDNRRKMSPNASSSAKQRRNRSRPRQSRGNEDKDKDRDREEEEEEQELKNNDKENRESSDSERSQTDED